MTGLVGKKIGNWMSVAFLAVAVPAAAGVAYYFSTPVHAAKASTSVPAKAISPEPVSANPVSIKQRPTVHQALSSKSKSRPMSGTTMSVTTSTSLPMFFEPNQGQTAPPVKFLARGAGYGLFLTSDEAVLQLQPARPAPRTATTMPDAKADSVIRMHLEGANSAAQISGAHPLSGKSNYFIGNDPAKWRRDIPQFARVQYQGVYPGVNLVYYGNQGQLEYDFRVAPGADPKRIALSFKGASARIVSRDATSGVGNSGDLILSTANGDVRFHAPIMYQENASGRQPVAGSFRLLADNNIGFTIGAYNHRRELIIDPVLSYSTYLGGSGTEGGSAGSNPENLVKIAIDSGNQIYVAGSTTSTDFPFPVPTNTNTPIQAHLAGAQNIFIAVLNLNPNLQQGQEQLVYATYLGGSGSDSLAGIAVDLNRTIYVAGSTTSNTSFPTTATGLNPGPVTAGTHGFLSVLSVSPSTAYDLSYSTFLAGNGVDTVTGLAIDNVGDAYLTGVTTSNNPATALNPFPANPNGYQTSSNSTGNPQFFASKINTTINGSESMLYSTYFGGGYPSTAIAIGGGIAVDPPPNNAPNMYITGTTTMLQVAGPNGEAAFPLFSAQQACLNEASKTDCASNSPTTTADAFVAKLNPNKSGFGGVPVYSTYLGGSGDETGTAIAVDSSGNAYVTGSTDSTDWVSPPSGFQTTIGGGKDAFIVKIGNIVGSVFPLTYFTYLGGSGDDSGQDITVDTVQAAHVVGSTNSSNFPTTLNTIQSTPGGGGDAFAASIGTSFSGQGAGDFSTYLGGSQLDQGTGVAIDIFGATYVAGTTRSPNFIPTPAPPIPPFQGQLNANSQDAFVSKIGAFSTLTLTTPNTSPSPNPVAAGTQIAFTFDIGNTNPNGTDPANLVVFNALGLPTTGLASTPTAHVTTGSGSCGNLQGSSIQCSIPTLAVNGTATVEVDVTPAVPVVRDQISISGNVSANGGPVQASAVQPIANVVDFTVQAFPFSKTVNAGDTATFQVVFSPMDSRGYNATITPSQTSAPSIVTSPAPFFNPTSVTLSGTGTQSTTLSITTVARPVPVGSLLRRGSFYATWLPIGGLSLAGLGIGVGRKRRRWLVAAVLGLIAGIVLLQPGCGSSSTSVSPTGGTLAGQYTITITGSAGAGASHTWPVTLNVR